MLLVKQLLFSLVISLLLSTAVSARTYWHYTLKTFDRSDQSKEEWAWITVVEMPKSRVFANDAATVRRLGGRLEGTIFALVRGAAWRAEHQESSQVRCGDHMGTSEVFWHESESESLYAGGQINNDGSFQLGINSGRKLMEDGTWFYPKSRNMVFTGPIRIQGQPAEKIKGKYIVRGINYLDPNKHHRRCRKAWVRQFRSTLLHFRHDSLRDSFHPGENSIWGQRVAGPDDSMLIVYSVERSNSRRHPHWKRQEM